MQVLALLDELRALAQTGLNFADNPYDRERYERILELVTEYYGEALDVPPAEVRDILADEIGQVTPKVGADAVMFDDDGQVLVMKRADNGKWCLPGGAVQMSESPEEAAIRETREETGLTVEPKTLIDVYRRGPTSNTPTTATTS
ncbi:MAG: NUDIX hydrolase N-terminal domain-containing protein, partial [Halobacteriaceae archaeon]